MLTSTSKVAQEILGEHAITVLDIGARWGAEDSWWRMKGLAQLVGFEPDPVECGRLNDCAERGEKYLPVALADAVGERTLHVAKHPACSSLYPPIEALIERYPVLEMMRQVGTCRVPTTSLDELQNEKQVCSASFIKLDTQGAELAILQGAQQVLEGCCGIEAELMFAPLYEGQPLFADVAKFLGARGFHPWRLNDACHHAESSPTPNDPSGRLFWVNAVFLRDYRELPIHAPTVAMHLTLASLYHAIGDLRASHGCISGLLASAGSLLSRGGRSHLEMQASHLTEAIDEKSAVVAA